MSSTAYNKIFKLLAVIAVSAVIAEMLYLLFGSVAFIMWPVELILCAFGYSMQALYGKITSPRRDLRTGYTDETGYEEMESAFKPLHAAGPFTVAIIISLLLYKPFDYMLFIASRIIPGLIYSENSLYPILMMIAAFIGIASGVVLWFFPAHRIISLRLMMQFLPIMWIGYLLAIFLDRPTDPMVAFLTVFAICSFIVLNQTHIQRGVNDTLTAINARGRMYNFRLMIFVFVVILFLTLVMLSIVIGISRIIGFIAALTIASVVNSSGGSVVNHDGQLTDVDSIYSSYGNLLGSNTPVGENILFVLFIILFIGGIILIITRGTEVTKRLIKRIEEWFSELFMFFMDAMHYNGKGKGEAEYDSFNYRDEEIKLQDAEINEYGKKRQPNTNSYRDFIAKLNGLPTAEERIRFAYTTMMKSYRERGMGNRVTETPREAKRRIEQRTSEDAVGAATDAIEAVDYMEKELPEEDSRRVIGAMRGVIEKHYIN